MIYVVLSLDTELGWGVDYGSRYDNLLSDQSKGRDSIKFLIDCFEEYEFPATWAVVGGLLTDTTPKRYSAKDRDIMDELFTAPEIVDWIKKSPIEHEIAAHSFSHPYFSNLSKKDARTELQMTKNAFNKHGENPTSFVHPYTDIAHVDLLSEFGFSVYAGSVQEGPRTLKGGLWPFVKRCPRFWKAPIVQLSANGYPIKLSRSRQLKDIRWGGLNPRRIRNSIKQDSTGLIHLTFHPHDLLHDPFLPKSLKRILQVISTYREKEKVEILTMEEAANCVEIKSGY